MKKNYIIASALIVAILIFTNTEFYRRNVLGIPEEKSTKTQPLVETATKYDTVPQAISAIEKSHDSIIQSAPADSLPAVEGVISEPAVPTRQPKTYTIQTENLKIKISDKGAAVKSVTLKNYTDAQGKPLVIFHSEKLNLLSLPNLFTDTVFYSTDIDSFISIDAGAKVLRFVHVTDSITVVKEYTVESNSHEIGVALSIESKAPFSGLSLMWNSPIIFNDFDDRDFISFVSHINNNLEEIKKDSQKDIVFTGTDYFWTGLRTKYFFGGYVFPSRGESYSGKVSTNFKIDRDYKRIVGGYSVGFEFPSDMHKKNMSYKLFFSPIDRYVLAEYGHSLIEIARYGGKILGPLSNVILLITSFIHGIVGNWGLAIIIFSVLLKLLLYPLNKKTILASRKMQELQPVVASLQQKHKANPQLAQMEMMKLYKQHKVNPLSGCLPMLLQMPIFFALYSVFRGAIQFRQAPFVLWIQDLSQPEQIMQLDLGFFSLNLGILVLISSLAMFFQMKMTIKDPRQRFMPHFMSIFLFFIFSNMSSGLNLYWATFNVMQFLQQILTEKKFKKS